MYLFLIDFIIRIAFAIGNMLVVFGIVFILFVIAGWETDFINWSKRK